LPHFSPKSGKSTPKLGNFGGMDAAVITALGGVLPEAKSQAQKPAWTPVFGNKSKTYKKQGVYHVNNP
jgi:hypothetical protein